MCVCVCGCGCGCAGVSVDRCVPSHSIMSMSLLIHSVPFDLEDSASVPAVMSFTKNPNKAKKSGFFKKVFRYF